MEYNLFVYLQLINPIYKVHGVRSIEHRLIQSASSLTQSLAAGASCCACWVVSALWSSGSDLRSWSGADGGFLGDSNIGLYIYKPPTTPARVATAIWLKGTRLLNMILCYEDTKHPTEKKRRNTSLWDTTNLFWSQCILYIRYCVVYRMLSMHKSSTLH